MSEKKFYVIVDPDNSSDTFFVTNDDGYLKPFDTEAEAVEACKEYSGPSIVVGSVLRVTEKTSYKVSRVK